MPRDLIAGHRFSNAAAVRHRSIPSHARILENVLGPAKAGFLAPMLCLAVNELPTGQEWTYEVKLDGYRALGLKSGGRVVLGSRNAKDFTRRFSTVALALNAIPDETLIDGEIVAIGDDGLPAFAKLQDSRAGQPEIVFYAFDLPFMHGLDLRSKPLDTRFWEHFDGITVNSSHAAFRKFHQGNLQQCYRLLLRGSSFLSLTLHERIGLTLLELCADFGIEDSRGTLLRVAFSHQHLANLVGASRPRVTEHLARLERERVVIRPGRQLVVRADKLENSIGMRANSN